MTFMVECFFYKTKFSCGQVDMTFVKTARQLKIVLGFLTSDLLHTIELNLASRSSMSFYTKLLHAVPANERKTLLAVIFVTILKVC